MSERRPVDLDATPETQPSVRGPEHPDGAPTRQGSGHRHRSAHVSPDGSPVAVYLAVPAGDTPTLINQALGGPSTVLELGAGAGRITRVLSAYGHEVVAVDDDPAMLEHVTSAEVVCADLYELDLERRFDAVIAGSHFINVADETRRRRLMEVAAAHVARPDGLVLLERHRPEWARDPSDAAGYLGPVEVALKVEDRSEDAFSAVVTYRLGERTWRQPFTAVVVDDDDLDRLGEPVGLRFDGVLDDEGTWVRLRPTDRDGRGGPAAS